MQSLLKWCPRVGVSLALLGLVPTAQAAGADNATAAAQVTPLPAGPVMPPTALPPLPPLPNGMYSGPTGLPLPGGVGQVPIRRAPAYVQAPAAAPRYEPPRVCPTAKVFVKAIMSFDNSAQADVCAGGILHPGLSVGDSINGMKIVAIDANSVSVRGQKGSQRLSMSPR